MLHNSIRKAENILFIIWHYSFAKYWSLRFFTNNSGLTLLWNWRSQTIMKTLCSVSAFTNLKTIWVFRMGRLVLSFCPYTCLRDSYYVLKIWNRYGRSAPVIWNLQSAILKNEKPHLFAFITYVSWTTILSKKSLSTAVQSILLFFHKFLAVVLC